MSKLQVRKIDNNAVIPVLAGSPVFPIKATDIRYEAMIRAGREQAKAYWLRTGLQFNVPEGHVLKVYPVQELAHNNLARLADCVALVEPGDHNELTLRMVIDDGGKSFEPRAGMVVARAMLEKTVSPELVEVEEFDFPKPVAKTEKAKKTVTAQAEK